MRNPVTHFFILIACIVTTSLQAGDVKYNRDVRPILADKCFHCHGPDSVARQADLRLDKRVDAVAFRDGNPAVKPGQPEESELIRRIMSTEIGLRMPPDDSGATLSRNEVEILRQWIVDGAQYQIHWAFNAPERTPYPKTNPADWPKNAIDNFVLQRLHQAGLGPSPEANAETLIRRVTLDLTGLPPTLPEVDDFLTQYRTNSDAAWLRLVDRLLASPRYGEKMAVAWLDVARYADTNGYFTDNDRTMWPWRDWVINAFNRNMPFDQFTVEQLAGDLLPDSTIDQKIATGFNRNHMVNNETGIIEEEFRVEYVVDRVDTTATTWMGLTIGCARCHDHKYDPVSQKDFYRFFAYFNNVPERGLSGSSGNAAPFLKVTSPQLQRKIEDLQQQLAAGEQKFATLENQLDAAQRAWEQTAVDQIPLPATNALTAHFSLDKLPTDAVVGDVKSVPGHLDRAAKFDGDACLSFGDAVRFESTDSFSFGAWVFPRKAGCIISKTDDANEMRGFDLTMRKGRAVVNLVHQWNRNAIQVATKSAVSSGQWQHLMVTYDGSRRAAGVRIFVNGKLQQTHVSVDTLTQSIANTEPLRIGRRQASASFTGMIDDIRFYNRQLSAAEASQLYSSQLVRGVCSASPKNRSAAQKRRLRSWFIENHADADLAKASANLERLRANLRDMQNRVPTTMVMQEAKEPRAAFLLVRGEYDKHGEELTAGLPEFLRPVSNKRQSGQSGSDSRNRLGLANWIVSPGNPLTARVTVNRLWQQLFGTGIVRTVDDFGTQGEWPSHPQLLDTLAVELVDSGWNIKHMMKMMVTSATYRQSSHCSPEVLRKDPENRLLARGPRFRLPAESIRDNALAISGLLVNRIGGPSVKPYQPAGLWQDVTYDSDTAYGQAKGESLYRRSLYTFWKRQSPPPNMLVFDAPTRETCTVSRSRTNTPLQALVLMNDPGFVEASRKLAERIMKEADGSPTERIALAFRLATSRRPTPEETRILLETYEKQRREFRSRPDEVATLLNVGDSDVDDSLVALDLATWTTIAGIVLSLDETITKP